MNIAKLRTGWVLVILLAAVSGSFAQQRLFVVGGGARPAEAVKRFVEWSGGRNARILVITWASGVPNESFESLRKAFAEAGAATVEHASVRPLDLEKRARFVGQLDNATAVFFSGGDQNRIMDVLKDEPELIRSLRAKYSSGMPFGGTSAGAAVMSDPMMTGDADLKVLDGKKVGVRSGLGLIPDVMFDQHFLVRQRHNRLFGFVMENRRYLGIGIDEDNAVLIEDNQQVQVVGATWVMFVNSGGKNGSMTVNFLRPGERFDLKRRIRM
ncbi:MAG: cyanophycinase [Pyrinomonadaceae bacterium]